MKRRMMLPEITLDRSAKAPALRLQIERQMGCAIREGRLAPGSRLPSSRWMAGWLGVSRGTVVEAYEALLEAESVVARQGSGLYVAGVMATVPNFRSLKKTVAAAHYPACVYRFRDVDGTGLYLNVAR